MEFPCLFCSKTGDNHVDITESSLLIGNTCLDFSGFLQELFGIACRDNHSLQSGFICEDCKNAAVNFYIFKQSSISSTNLHRKMISSQIEDFIKQVGNIEDIQIVRKLNSLTLQVDPASNQREHHEVEVPEEIVEVHEEILDFEMLQEDEVRDEEEIENENFPVSCSTCPKCNETFRGHSEIHEFMKHSLIGAQIENEESINTSEDGIFCSICSGTVTSTTELRSHLLTDHSETILREVNLMFSIDTSLVDIEAVERYLIFIRNLMESEEFEEKIDSETKKHFYDIYSRDDLKFQEPTDFYEELVEEIDSEEFVQMETDEVSENEEVSKEKPDKSSNNITDEDKNWIKSEILLRKKMIRNELGIEKTIYKCVYCKAFSSNSPQGFRYHLVSKHLKNKNLKEISNAESDTQMAIFNETTKRNQVCLDCSLKFKDHKALSNHKSFHETFQILSHQYNFNSCNTCNTLYIDEATLNLHLKNHDRGKQPIHVATGAVVLQGKLVPVRVQEPQITQSYFSWTCGHCSKSFNKETECRLHLLMTHVTNFICPIDKREFQGFKAVSLFNHHLKNKHPELFPELKFFCTFCKQQFRTFYDKLSHMKNCNEKKFECDHCLKKFFKKNELISHMKFVSGEVVFPCEFCDKKCETMSDLKIHLRSHTKERPFDCPQCKKSFRTLAARAAHVESHIQVMTYVCHCGKSFRQRQAYKRHFNQHK